MIEAGTHSLCTLRRSRDLIWGDARRGRAACLPARLAPSAPVSRCELPHPPVLPDAAFSSQASPFHLSFPPHRLPVSLVSLPPPHPHTHTNAQRERSRAVRRALERPHHQPAPMNTHAGVSRSWLGERVAPQQGVRPGLAQRRRALARRGCRRAACVSPVPVAACARLHGLATLRHSQQQRQRHHRGTRSWRAHGRRQPRQGGGAEGAGGRPGSPGVCGGVSTGRTHARAGHRLPSWAARWPPLFRLATSAPPPPWPPRTPLPCPTPPEAFKRGLSGFEGGSGAGGGPLGSITATAGGPEGGADSARGPCLCVPQRASAAPVRATSTRRGGSRLTRGTRGGARRRGPWRRPARGARCWRHCCCC